MPPQTVLWPIVLAALVGGLVTFGFNLLLRRTGRRLAWYDSVDLFMEQSERRLDMIDMKMGFFWRLVEEHMAHLLKKPTHLEMDRLLDKLAAHTLSLPDAYALRRHLDETYFGSEQPSPTHRAIAVLVLAAVNALIVELEQQRP